MCYNSSDLSYHIAPMAGFPKFFFGFESFLICLEEWVYVMRPSPYGYTTIFSNNFWNKLNLGYHDMNDPV